MSEAQQSSVITDGGPQEAESRYPWDTPSNDHRSGNSAQTPASNVASRRRKSPKTPAVHQPANPYARPTDLYGRTLASWSRRAIAYLIDAVILTAVWIGAWIASALVGTHAIATIVNILIDTVYFSLLVAGPRGQTPGMRTVGIAVRDRKTGGTIGFRRALVRSLTMGVLSAALYLPFVLDCLWPLWDSEYQSWHDKAARTLVVEVNPTLGTSGSAPSFTAATPFTGTGAAPDFTGTAARRQIATRFLAAVHRWLHARTRRFWLTAATVAALIVVAAALMVATTSVLAAEHSPTKAATAYLSALSRKDASAILVSTGIIEPSVIAPDTAVLLSSHDIERELSAPGNGPGTISHLVVVASHIHDNTATVTLSYVADNQSHIDTCDLVRSDHTASGWVVQVTPSRLDVDIPQGTTHLTVAGIPVRTTGTFAHVYLFPSVVTVATPATAIFDAASTTINTTHQSVNADSQEASLAPQLTAAAQFSAVNAVVNQINACLAATSLTPTNCPNTDTPATEYQGDTYSGISWTGLGQPTAGFTANVNRAGQVEVSGAFTAEVTYTDTTPGSSFFGSVSDQETDGPTSWNFTYPLSWNGTGWVLGTVNAQTADN